ncbi:hypothetical protein IC582_016576 [Cucumis melo]
MPSSIHYLATLSFTLFFFFSSPDPALGRKLAALLQQQPLTLEYHKGSLLKGNITINFIWYGQFTSSQRSLILDFIQSLTYSRAPPPSASLWWKTTENYKGGTSNLVVGKQILHESYTLGKNLNNLHLRALAMKVNQARTAYVWVGNSESQCPGYCAWPFHQPIYGPQTPPLIAPNGDVGVDGMIINLATVLAGTVTNPFNDGYYQGPPTAPLEAVSACTGLFGSGAYPGYPGKVLVDKVTGASFNAYGVNGRKFLLPAMWDPKSSACKTLV